MTVVGWISSYNFICKETIKSWLLRVKRILGLTEYTVLIILFLFAQCPNIFVKGFVLLKLKTE